MPVHIDFSSSPELVDGTYPVVVKTCKEDESSSGNPCIKCSFQVTDGDFVGQMIFATLSLQAHALFAVKGFLKALDYDTSEGIDFEPDDVIGKELEVTGKVSPDFGFGIKKFSAL